MLDSMNAQEMRRRKYLDALGVVLWELHHKPVAFLPDSGFPLIEETNFVRQSHQSDVKCMNWPDLENAVKTCIKCSLHTSRTQTVFGVGNRQAKWMFIGEAPGGEEDRQGEPFVGRAGQLLNAILFAIGLKREEVYIANVLKCRPPGNRDPQPEEVTQCEPYLLRQINLIKPRLIVALGRHAAHSLLKTEVPLGKLRGQRLSYHGTPLIVTYHPAYLLRNPADKRKVWDDLCLARSLVRDQ
jgi:DNA polymerase